MRLTLPQNGARLGCLVALALKAIILGLLFWVARLAGI